jgi:hypothetical protein
MCVSDRAYALALTLRQGALRAAHAHMSTHPHLAVSGGGPHACTCRRGERVTRTPPRLGLPARAQMCTDHGKASLRMAMQPFRKRQPVPFPSAAPCPGNRHASDAGRGKVVSAAAAAGGSGCLVRSPAPQRV